MTGGEVDIQYDGNSLGTMGKECCVAHAKRFQAVDPDGDSFWTEG
jgi:hypothetical protein